MRLGRRKKTHLSHQKVSRCVHLYAFNVSSTSSCGCIVWCVRHGGAAADGTFEDSFASPREWHARVRPAAVSVAMTLKVRGVLFAVYCVWYAANNCKIVSQVMVDRCMILAGCRRGEKWFYVSGGA